jgi:hypothetical protein
MGPIDSPCPCPTPYWAARKRVASSRPAPLRSGRRWLCAPSLRPILDTADTGSGESAVGRGYLPRNSCGPSDAVWFLSIMSNTLVSYAMNSSWDTVPSPSVSILCIISLVCRPRA